MSARQIHKRVFISSTAEDLVEHRAAVAKAIETLGGASARMETFGADPDTPVAVCTAGAAAADALVVIVAHRYGWTPRGDDGGDGRKSITWLEVQAARAAGKPIFAFIVDERHPWTARKESDRMNDPDVADDDEKIAQVTRAVRGLRDFKKWLSSELGVVRATFTTPDHLASVVTASLAKHWLGGADNSRTQAELQLREHFGTFLNAAFQRLAPVPLFAVSQQHSDAKPVSVYSVYTALDVTLEVGAKASRSQVADRVWEMLKREADEHEGQTDEALPLPMSRRVRAIEAAAVAPRLVVLGSPGSGKSTFARHLTVCLLGQLIGKPEAHNGTLYERQQDAAPWMPWEQRPYVPLFVELADFVRSPCFPSTERDADAGLFFEYLSTLGKGAVPEEARKLHQHCAKYEGDGVLLILDGLDETPDAEATRVRVQRCMAAFVREFPKARVIVTSRPYAYQPGSPWRLDPYDFEQVELGWFSWEQITAFCEHWYRGMAERDPSFADKVDSCAQALHEQLAAAEYLQPLAERPLMLTMLADVHTQGGRLPSSRAALYEKSTELLLDRWNEARSGLGSEPKLSQGFGIDPERVRRAVEAVAYRVQCDMVSDDPSSALDGPARGAYVSPGLVMEELRRVGSRGRAEELLDYLHQRSGILVEESNDRFRFPHHSYQEFLAACHLTHHDFPTRLTKHALQDVERWREVLPYAILRAARGFPHAAWQLVQAVREDAAIGSPDVRALVAMLCTRGLVEGGLHAPLEGQYVAHAAWLRSRLREACEQGWLSAVDRAEAADLLCQLGERRVVADTWTPVPEGGFWMGAQSDDEGQQGYDVEAFSNETPVHWVEVAAFEIAREPVTVGQYAEFLVAGGYSEREYWDDKGWVACRDNDWEGPADFAAQQRYPDRPVVGVSWFEACAYARYKRAALPTEAQWERAARFPDGRRYPWEGEFDAERCNSIEAGARRVVAVGIYPQGNSALGIADLSGNIWEWCSDRYGLYSAESDTDPSGPTLGSGRVLRGGSWGYVARYVRAAIRRSLVPDYRNDGIGFRLARGQSRAGQ